MYIGRQLSPVAPKYKDKNLERQERAEKHRRPDCGPRDAPHSIKLDDLRKRPEYKD